MKENDTISRQTAIDALKAIKIGLWEIDIPHPGNCPEYIEHHKQIQEMMGVVGNWIERIKALPTAEPTAGCEYWDTESNYCALYRPAAVPTAEKTGKWMKTVTLYPYCSECDWMPEEDEMTHGFYRYCPNCGAKMMEESDG